MKKKSSRILGVLLTLALVSSLIIISAPVSAGTHSWTALSNPSTTGLVLDPGNIFTGPFDIDINGSAIYASSNTAGPGMGGALGLTGNLVKSTDGGRTWTMLTGFPGVNPVGAYPSGGAVGFSVGTITDIVCSSRDANTVYVTDGYDVWKSIDGGVNWQPLTNLFQHAGASLWSFPPIGVIVALDVGYTAVGSHVFAAVNSFGGGTGGIYVCYEWQFGMPWGDMDVGNQRPIPMGPYNVDAQDVKVDPTNFAATQMVMALVNTYGPVGTFITTKYTGLQWGVTATDVFLPGIVSGYNLTGTLWLPSNFSPDPSTGNMQVYAGLTTLPVLGDVFLAILYPAVTPYLPVPGFDLNVSGPGTVTQITGLDGEGPIGSCALLACGRVLAAPTIPNTWSSTNGGATWLGAIKRPTGDAGTFGPFNVAWSSVLVMPGFMTSGTAIIGTHGFDCGVSITHDFGATWNTISLINGSGFLSGLPFLDAIQDFATNLADGTVFVSTESGYNFVDSIWRLTDNWERVYSSTLNTISFDPELVEVSPAGDAVFLGDVDGPFNLFRSLDAGQIWTMQVSAIPGAAIPSWLVVSKDNVLVGGVDVIYDTYTNGSFWVTRQVFPALTGILIQSIAVSSNPGDLLAAGVGGGNARVARSQDNGLNWTAITAKVPFSTAGALTVIVDFAYGYGSNQMIYATGTDVDGDAGLWRYDYDATDPSVSTPTWQRIDNSLGTPPSYTVTPAPVTVPADSFTLTCTTAGTVTIVNNSVDGQPKISVVATGGAPTITFVPGVVPSWTVVMNTVGDAVTVTAINDLLGSPNGTVITDGTAALTVSSNDADGDAIFPATPFPASTARNFVLPDIVSTTIQPPSTVVTPYNVSAGIGLVTAPGGPQGMCYAMDSVDSASRVKTFDYRRASQVGAELMAGPAGITFLAGNDGFVSFTAAGGLWYTTGSNILYAITNTALGPRIYTYTDTLNVAGSGVAFSNVTTTSATVSWNDLANASGYTVVVNATPPATAQADNFFTAATDAGITVVVNATANTALVTGLSPVTTYFVSVWGTRSGVSSFLFTPAATSFTTLPMTPTNISPIPGATDVALQPTFDWTEVAGATSYELQLGMANDFSDADSVTTTVTQYTWQTELLYDHNYYWRVRAVTAAGNSGWCESTFHTRMEEIPPVTVEPPPTPTIILPTPTVVVPDITVVPPDITVVPPDITVNVPLPPVTQVPPPTLVLPERAAEPTPIYIWIIVAIGAVLTIAVIVLIIRTRRVV
jgi:hypothetical protein